jgi:hypothetical protein
MYTERIHTGDPTLVNWLAKRTRKYVRTIMKSMKDVFQSCTVIQHNIRRIKINMISVLYSFFLFSFLILFMFMRPLFLNIHVWKKTLIT